jgi:hypothetical protein
MLILEDSARASTISKTPDNSRRSSGGFWEMHVASRLRSWSGSVSTSGYLAFFHSESDRCPDAVWRDASPRCEASSHRHCGGLLRSGREPPIGYAIYRGNAEPRNG